MWIGQLLASILYGVKFKKIRLQVKPCDNPEKHYEHAWSRTNKGYIQYAHYNPYYCEGKN